MRLLRRAESTACLVGVVCILMCALQAGCGKPGNANRPSGLEPPPPGEEPGIADLCDFQGGPADAPIKVKAFFPGRHEDTIVVLKKLLEDYPGKVCLEIVDWRTREGRERRDDAGLTCAGIVINGRNAFTVQVDGKQDTIMFLRGVNGEWREEHLIAAVEQILAATQ